MQIIHKRNLSGYKYMNMFKLCFIFFLKAYFRANEIKT